MRSLLATRKWSSILMVLAIMCNILAGTKLFCGPQKLSQTQEVMDPAGVIALTPDMVTLNEPLPDVVNVADSDGPPPRCACKKTKSCSAIPRVVVVSNPTQRFNQYQHQAWSEGSNCVGVRELLDNKTLWGDDAAYLNRLDVLARDCLPGKLALSCVLLI